MRLFVFISTVNLFVVCSYTRRVPWLAGRHGRGGRRDCHSAVSSTSGWAWATRPMAEGRRASTSVWPSHDRHSGSVDDSPGSQGRRGELRLCRVQCSRWPTDRTRSASHQR